MLYMLAFPEMYFLLHIYVSIMYTFILHILKIHIHCVIVFVFFWNEMVLLCIIFHCNHPKFVLLGGLYLCTKSWRIPLSSPALTLLSIRNSFTSLCQCCSYQKWSWFPLIHCLKCFPNFIEFQNHLGGLLNCDRITNSEVMEWGLTICIPNKFSGDDDAAGPYQPSKNQHHLIFR